MERISLLLMAVVRPPQRFIVCSCVVAHDKRQLARVVLVGISQQLDEEPGTQTSGVRIGVFRKIRIRSGRATS
jgi:hypothetical protein